MQQAAALSFVLGLALPAFAQQAEPAPPQEPPAVGQIALHRDGALVLIGATGGEPITLVENVPARPLLWLPGGERLLYCRRADDGSQELWSVDPDADPDAEADSEADDEAQQLVADGDVGAVAVTRDGTRLAFTRRDQGIWLAGPDGSEPVQVSEVGQHDIAPVWSLFNEQLVYNTLATLDDGAIATRLHLIRFAGDVITDRLDFDEGRALFSLNEIQFVVAGDFRGTHDLLVVDVRSSKRRSYTKTPKTRDSHAVLSPDRRRIAWVEDGERDEKTGRRLMHMWVDGSTRRVLAELEHFDAPPSWSPDDRHVVFESGSGPDTKAIHVVSIEGGPVQSLGAGSHPAWRPVVLEPPKQQRAKEKEKASKLAPAKAPKK